MKKSILKSLLALIIVSALVTPALAANDEWVDPADSAATGITDETGTVGPGLPLTEIKFSANVQFYYASDAADGAYFGLGTYNTKGTKVYASNSDSSKIYATVTAVTPDDYTDVTPVASGSWATSEWSEVGK